MKERFKEIEKRFTDGDYAWLARDIDSYGDEIHRKEAMEYIIKLACRKGAFDSKDRA